MISQGLSFVYGIPPSVRRPVSSAFTDVLTVSGVRYWSSTFCRTRTSFPGSDISPLGDLQGVLDVDAQIANGALQLRVPKQELNGPKVSRASVDQRSFGPAHRVRAVGARLEAGIFHPAMDDPGLLPRRQVGRFRDAAAEQEIRGLEVDIGDPSLDGLASRLGDLELDRSPRLFLQYDCAGCYLAAMRDVRYPKLNQIAGA